jgi:malonyl-CoA O-methyltransferase
MTPDDPQPFRLDRPGIRASFDRASVSYEAAAVLQARVADELLSRLVPFNFTPGVVLDLGAGTGRMTGELKRRYRRSLVVALDLAPGMLREARRHQAFFRRFERVCADAVRLPIAAASVDLVVSSLMLQWCDPPDSAFAEIRRILKPEGFFAFSTFGPDTLRELRSAWAEADEGATHAGAPGAVDAAAHAAARAYNHVNHFTDMHDVGDALVRAGLSEPVLDVDRMQVTYADSIALMRDLKAIGAHNVTAGRPRGLVGRARLKRMQLAYETFRRDGRLPATYEVVYGVAWGAAGKPASAMVGGEARIPPSAIKRRSDR